MHRFCHGIRHILFSNKRSVMRILSLLGLFTGSLLLACANNATLAQNQNKSNENKKTGKSGVNETRFEQKVHAINEADKKKGQMDTVLEDICNNVNLNLE